MRPFSDAPAWCCAFPTARTMPLLARSRQFRLPGVEELGYFGRGQDDYLALGNGLRRRTLEECPVGEVHDFLKGGSRNSLPTSGLQREIPPLSSAIRLRISSTETA